MDFSLGRIIPLLDHLGNPQNRIRTIHVAGTNGKGSTVAYLASILRSSGYSVGTLTSPHLYSPRDSIRINKLPVSSMIYKDAMETVDAASKEIHIQPTSFERLAATAFVVFAELKLDIAVIECGMGGRTDATNVLETPLVVVILSISYDHIKELGPTLKDIALNKCGIIKQGSKVILAPQVYPEVMDVVRGYCRDKEAHLTLIDPSEWFRADNDSNVTSTWSCRSVQSVDPTWIDGVDASPGLGTAEVQVANLATALATLHVLCSSHPSILHISDANLLYGITHASNPGRNSVLSIQLDSTPGKQVKLFVDGAHNPDAAIHLSGYIKKRLRIQGKPMIWVVAFSGLKDAGAVLRAFELQKGDTVLAVEFATPIEDMPWVTAMPVSRLSSMIRDVHGSDVMVVEIASLAAALEYVGAHSQKLQHDMDAVVCGSLYLMSELYRKWIPEETCFEG